MEKRGGGGAPPPPPPPARPPPPTPRRPPPPPRPDRVRRGGWRPPYGPAGLAGAAPAPAARADPPDSTPARPDQNRISAVKTVTEAFEPTPRALALKSQPVPKLRFR